MNRKTKAGIIGVAGYIAPRHLYAMKKNNIELTVSNDISDSVGIIDRYFPNAYFTCNYRDFINKIYNNIDYLTICTPNFLHKKHVIDGLRSNSNIICEKPTVLQIKDLDIIQKEEQKHSKKVYSIMQLRYHPEIIKLKKYLNRNHTKIFDIELTYVSGRGNWFKHSWKGNFIQSGGIVTNIGIHLFDILIHLFGKVINSKVHILKDDTASGFLQLAKGNVKWFLSTNFNNLPTKKKSLNVYRNIKVNNNLFKFSSGFDNLHNISYKKIIESKGFTTENVRDSIMLTSNINYSKISSLRDDVHRLTYKYREK